MAELNVRITGNNWSMIPDGEYVTIRVPNTDWKITPITSNDRENELLARIKALEEENQKLSVVDKPKPAIKKTVKIQEPEADEDTETDEPVKEKEEVVEDEEDDEGADLCACGKQKNKKFPVCYKCRQEKFQKAEKQPEEKTSKSKKSKKTSEKEVGKVDVKNLVQLKKLFKP